MQGHGGAGPPRLFHVTCLRQQMLASAVGRSLIQVSSVFPLGRPVVKGVLDFCPRVGTRDSLRVDNTFWLNRGPAFSRFLINAPAGSRARGTSMGGLYVAATLQALVSIEVMSTLQVVA
jgi:hypothetical protein